MLNTVRLLLPALIPSWNFFEAIAPSPRIEYALAKAAGTEPTDWREFRPRPDRVSPVETLRRLFWNPRWNESLFLVSCAERLILEPTAHSETEILQRVARDVAHDPDAWLTIRLMFVHREGATILREEAFRSAPRRIADLAQP